jgi:hypothetical protein
MHCSSGLTGHDGNLERGRRSGKRQSFIDYRRQYISDRTWFGLGFFAVGIGNFGVEHGWLRILMAVFGLLGVALAASGIRRACRRTEFVSPEPRPSAPW